MAIIAQRQLFSYKIFGFFSDLERLEFLLKHLPDEKLMRTLENHRGNGRDDYPVRAMWNSLLAGLVYKHNSITSLREELMRNASLLEVCGFDVFKGKRAVPSADAYTNFFANLIKFKDEVSEIFYELVKLVSDDLEGFGENLAMDSKVRIKLESDPRVFMALSKDSYKWSRLYKNNCLIIQKIIELFSKPRRSCEQG